jgi:hypothetical protein
MSVAKNPPAAPSGAPFVASLRVRPDVVRLGSDSETRLTFRVEMPEVWDTVRVEAPGSTTVREVKDAALAVLFPDADFPDDYVVKLNGYELREEHASLANARVKDGSTLLLTFRRRRPVRN